MVGVRQNGRAVSDVVYRVSKIYVKSVRDAAQALGSLNGQPGVQ